MFRAIGNKIPQSSSNRSQCLKTKVTSYPQTLLRKKRLTGKGPSLIRKSFKALPIYTHQPQILINHPKKKPHHPHQLPLPHIPIIIPQTLLQSPPLLLIQLIPRIFHLLKPRTRRRYSIIPQRRSDKLAMIIKRTPKTLPNAIIQKKKDDNDHGSLRPFGPQEGPIFSILRWHLAISSIHGWW